MNWLSIVILAYFLFALAYILDKFILSKISLEPIAYAFYVGILGIFVFVLAPFDFYLIPLKYALISFFTGALFTFGLFFLYKSFQKSEISRIVPVIGGAIPVFTLIFAYFFLFERLSQNQMIAFVLLVIGGIIISKGKGKGEKTSFSALVFAFLAALLWSSSFVLSKFLYSNFSFINAFIWIRVGGVLGALFLLVFRKNRRIIFRTNKKMKFKEINLVVFNKLLGAIAFILLNYGIFLGSVSLANALQGIQYLFLLIMAIFLSRKFPWIIKEKIKARIIIQKLIAIIFIAIGLAILAF